MLKRMLDQIRAQLRARHGPMAASGISADIVLGRRALYILPTREGLYYGGMLAVMLLAAVNYSNGLAYALTFMLAAVGIVATLHTHRNLSGLRISAGPAAPVFVGESATFTIILHNDSSFPRNAVEISATNQVQRVYMAPRNTALVDVTIPTTRRGYLDPPPIRLRTRFPVGLWHAWSRTISLPVRCLVYPRPAPAQSLPEAPGTYSGQEAANAADGEDFTGLRDYQHGDPMQRVAWKKVAAGQGWHTKQFTASAGRLIWLDWNALPGIEVENRLSVLCRWILMAEQLGITYGLRLPKLTIEPRHGAEHCARCLEQLALFGVPT